MQIENKEEERRDMLKEGEIKLEMRKEQNEKKCTEWGSGCGAVRIAVTSNTTDMQLESRHQHFVLNVC